MDSLSSHRLNSRTPLLKFFSHLLNIDAVPLPLRPQLEFLHLQPTDQRLGQHHRTAPSPPIRERAEPFSISADPRSPSDNRFFLHSPSHFQPHPAHCLQQSSSSPSAPSPHPPPNAAAAPPSSSPLRADRRLGKRKEQICNEQIRNGQKKKFKNRSKTKKLKSTALFAFFCVFAGDRTLTAG